MSLNSFRNGLGNITSSPAGKWTLFAVGAVLVFSLVFSGLGNNLSSSNGGGPGRAAAASGSDVIATVNGDSITRDDFSKESDLLRSRYEQFGRTISVSETPQLNNAVLDQLINAKLQLQQAKKMNIAVSDDELQKERSQIVDMAGFRQKLSLPPTASLADVDAALVKAGHAPLAETLPDDTLRQIILLGDPQSGQPGKMQTAAANSVVVTEEEARQFYTKYHTRHILIDNKKRSDVQAKAQAAQILAKAIAPGADFAALAKQYSEDPGTKDKGGDDGFIDQSTNYVPEFKKAAFSLKPGQVTPDPVAVAQFGYFIIKLDEVKSSLPADFDKNKAKFIADIKQQRAQEQYQDLMTSLKDSAKIEVNDPSLAGDRAFSQAARLGNPAQSQPMYQEALADYQKALKNNPPLLEKAAINAALGQVYQSLHQTAPAIAAYGEALKSRDDPALEMTLGQLYMQTHDKDNAVTHFQKASQLAWNDQSTHLQLMSNFQMLGHPDLSAKEADWLKQYLKAHPAPGGNPNGFPMMPGGPSAGANGPQPAGAVHVLPGGAVHMTPSAKGAIHFTPGTQPVTIVNGQPAKPTQ